MNSLILRFKKACLTAFALGSFGFLPETQAVEPAAPDTALPKGNTADGHLALAGLTTGFYNSAFGAFSLLSNGAASFNTGVGAGTLLASSGENNTATGAGALLSNSVGDDNTANGAFALLNNTTGSSNTAIGDGALQVNIIGSDNVAVGAAALLNSNSDNNTAVGAGALNSNATGIGNIALGAGAGDSVVTASGVICIGNSGLDMSNTTWIGNVYGTTTVSGTTLPVIVSDGGQLGTTPSSARFKKEIKPMDKASESVLALKPVTFHYKSDKTNTPQFGLVAEEVAAVNPDLTVRDKNGEIYTVRYDAVNAMLLNEFLKAHRKLEEQGAIIARQQKQIEALTAGLQKVSAQLEANKSVPQLAASNP